MRDNQVKLPPKRAVKQHTGKRLKYKRVVKSTSRHQQLLSLKMRDDSTGSLKLNVESVINQSGKNKARRLLNRKVSLIILGLILVITSGAAWVLKRNSNSQVKEILGAQTDQPDFNTLLPTQSDVAERSYDNERQILSFRSSLSGVPVIVSEQLAPPDLNTDPNGLNKLALSLSDKKSINKLNSKFGTTFVVTLQSGSQVAIFATDGLLVFARATTTIPDNLWIEYINGLK